MISSEQTRKPRRTGYFCYFVDDFIPKTMKIILSPKTGNSRFLLSGILVLLLATTSKAQVKVAQYSYGKYGTDKYEQFVFYTQDGKRSAITYSYGKQLKEVKLT